MTWIADSAFQIGSSHRVCQDYAMHDGQKAVLSDGCSSAPHTDVGARLLCWNEMLEEPLSLSSLACHASMIGITDKSLFATQLLVEADENYGEGSVIANIEGDGYLIAGFNNGRRPVVVKIDYKNNMPWYPIYRTIPIANTQFSWESVSVTVLSELVDNCPVRLRVSTHQFTGYSLEDDSAAFFAVCSDGLGTFRDENNNPVPETVIAAQLCDIKVRNENCIRRRVQSLNRREWKSWKHEDDFSIAGLVRGDS